MANSAQFKAVRVALVLSESANRPWRAADGDGTAIVCMLRAAAPLIIAGAILLAFPAKAPAAALAGQTEFTAAQSNHWAFRPVTVPALPEVGRTGQVRSPVDRFILQKLEARGLKPSLPAEKPALLRRATYDLTGLPPTPEELHAFMADRSPSAFSNVVERLLASPRYGERWGRHWMDVVRYADTAGDNADYPVPELYRYRDYIIDSFNADKPYDEFVREQLAGDILARQGPRERYAERVVATGFLALSRRYGTGPYELWHLSMENAIATTGQAFLGINLRCARCHDHKFDPVTSRDYYGLYGIFGSTTFPWAGAEEIASKNFSRTNFAALLPDDEAAPKWRAWEDRLKSLREQISELEKAKAADKSADKPADKERDAQLATLKKEARNLEKPGVPPDLPAAYAVREGTPGDVAIQRKGEPDRPGPIAPRCLPEFLAGGEPLRAAPGSSGRLEFAQWLTRPSNPLFARVMVNRIWQHHFGAGLVETPNNLGLRGPAPTHPELLDYLSSRFVTGGWSIKALHRLIMNSAVYRQSSEEPRGADGVDPSNQLLGHFGRRRLEAEAIRDGMLFASGELDLARPGPQPFPPTDKWTWTQHAPFKEQYESNHRAVYLMTQRFQKHPFLALFDGPDTNESTEARRASTVPQQALFALNDPWLDQRARALARRALDRPASSLRERVRWLHETAYARKPARAELRQCEDWLARGRSLAAAAGMAPGESEEEAWIALARVVLASNEFIYVD
jgi:hypothetical protein